MTHMGFVTIVEEAPATIEDQKLTKFGLSVEIVSEFMKYGHDGTYWELVV